MYSPFQVTSQHLNGIKIWALTRPFQDSPFLGFQPVSGGFTGFGSLSCCRVRFCFSYNFLTDGLKCSSSTLWCAVEFMVVSMMVNWPDPTAAQYPQTMTHPPQCFTVGIRLFSWDAVCNSISWTRLFTEIYHSVHLHAQLSGITAIVQLCYSVRQLQLSEYTCRWENHIIGWSVSYPGTIGGAVPISTSGNRATSGWPLYITRNNKLCLGFRERWRTEMEMKLHLCTFRIWCTW